MFYTILFSLGEQIKISTIFLFGSSTFWEYKTVLNVLNLDLSRLINEKKMKFLFFFIERIEC